MKTYTLILLASVIGITACNSNDNKAVVKKDKYEQTKETLEQTEKKNPIRFLTVSGHDKHNLIGQMVIKGTITNTAKIASYKDVDIEISFYSKTGALLEKDNETIFETIGPGQSQGFKTKYFAPKGSDSVALAVIRAKSE
ncbi:MAG: FxLYD domain-containing protein [Chitinophagaceae bacterium]